MAKKKKKDLPKAGADKGKDAGAPGDDRSRVIAVLAMAAALGVGGGAILVGKLPIRELLPSARAANALARGDAQALTEAAGADRDAPDEIARAALADALLVVDFAGGAAHRDRLAGLAKADAAAKKLPEALLARAIAMRLGGEDATLDADIAAAGGGEDAGGKSGDHPKGKGEHPKGEQPKGEEAKDRGGDDVDQPDQAAAVDAVHPATRLARATRLLAKGRLDDAWDAAQRAALRPDAPVYAVSAAARLALARGEPALARALAERGLERAPGNGMLLTLLVAAGALDRPAEAGKRKDRGDDHEEPKGEHPDRGGAKAGGARSLPVSAGETRATRSLEELSPRDAAVLSWSLEALALARGDATQASAHGKRVLAELGSSATLAARQAELALLSGDVAAAEELVSAAIKQAAADPDLLLAQARVRALRQLPPDALKPGDRATGLADDGALVLPFGRVVLDAAAAGFPWHIELDPTIAPDHWLRAERATGGADLEGRLGVIENVWKGEHALRRGDVPAAVEAASAARAKAPKNVDVLLIDARTRLLKGDREGMRAALKDALAAGADDPRVAYAATRIAYDAEDLALTRTYLEALDRTGYKSPAALALGAVLAAREGDTRAAQAIIKEAETLSPDDLDVVRGRLVLARIAGNLGEVRKHADRALALDDARSPDPLLRAWEGEALFRKGEGERAQAVVQSVLAARPGLIDAHLAMGIALAGPKPLDAAASFAQAIQIGGAPAIVAEATKRRAAIADAPPLK